MLYQINKKHDDWLAVSTATRLRAVKDEQRHAIKHVHIKNNMMRATDGFCAMQAGVSDFWEGGFYIPVSQNQSRIWLVNIKNIYGYSDCKIIFPDFKMVFRDDFDLIISNGWLKKTGKHTHPSQLVYEIFEKTKHTLDIKYFNMIPPGLYDIYTDANHNDAPVIFKRLEHHRLFEIAVMPFRMQREGKNNAR